MQQLIFQDKEPSDHQVEKHHQCDLTVNACVQLSLLKQHIAIVHDVRILPGCSFCERLSNLACENVDTEIEVVTNHENLLENGSTVDELQEDIKEELRK